VDPAAVGVSVLNEVADWFANPDTWQGTNGIPARLGEHLLLTIVSMIAALALALPLAFWLGHTGRGGALAINITNIGRAVPTYAVLAILAVSIGSATLGPFGRAGLATLIALVLFALPPLVTNTYVGMREVDRDLVEAARGMGMSGWQVFRRVELPLARPLVLTGARLALVQVWATATIAALVAGPGLGRIITLGFALQDQAQVIGGALVVAVMALALEMIMAVVQRRSDPLRGQTRTVRRLPITEP
jgi:osmoprotectant transport system permease protein